MSYTKSIAANGVTFISALIPVFKSCPPCPICMPKYAALFALFGLELADYSHYLMPVMFFSMFISLASMLQQSKQRRLSILPFYLGLISSSLLFASKFFIDSLFISVICMLGIASAIVIHYFNLSKKTCHC